jgi:hypothetical protein
MTDCLHSIDHALSEPDLARLESGESPELLVGSSLRPVVRAGGEISLEPLRELMAAYRSIQWDDRQSSDRWLSPRLHHALRLSRREASNPGVWRFLAYVGEPSYVRSRWSQNGDGPARGRYEGDIHKQAFARLWWGAELFRNGASYDGVEHLFANQDLPNSCLHRPFVRLRPFAVGLIDELVLRGRGTVPASDVINDVARNINLVMGAVLPEAGLAWTAGVTPEYLQWMATIPEPVSGELPSGPPEPPVPQADRELARQLIGEVCEEAGLSVE